MNEIMEIFSQIVKEVKKFSDPEKPKKLYKFFKAFPGGYGEGDKFYGISMPNLRNIARDYKNLDLEELQKLFENEYHEIRMLGLIILIKQFELKKNIDRREEFVEFYLKNIEYYNNWDLIDVSAPKILGEYLLNKEKNLIYELAESNDLWKQRIAMLTTFTFIRNRKFEDCLKLAEMYLSHPHDLIHKATGWMLREIGNRHRPTESKFLKKYYQKMPRTMLRYSIEKYPEEERQKYLKGKI